MEYRSNITLSLTLEALDRLPELKEAVEAELEVQDIDTPMHNNLLFFADYVEGDTSPEGVPFVTIEWSHIRWYNDYPVIDSVNKLINELKTTSPKSYHFIRIGDNFDDVTDEGLLDDNLYVSRVIKRMEI